MTDLAPVSPFSAPAEVVAAALQSPLVECRRAASADEVALHRRIRHEVFVVEQRMFADDDHDAHDDARGTIHVLGLCCGVAAGAVRLYRLDADATWKGDRLAVLPDFRRCGLGGPLVRFAVSAAAAAGGERMIAYIQPQNVEFFERLGWGATGPVQQYVGRAHQQMVIDLRGRAQVPD